MLSTMHHGNHYYVQMMKMLFVNEYSISADICKPKFHLPDSNKAGFALVIDICF